MWMISLTTARTYFILSKTDWVVHGAQFQQHFVPWLWDELFVCVRHLRFHRSCWISARSHHFLWDGQRLLRLHLPQRDHRGCGSQPCDGFPDVSGVLKELSVGWRLSRSSWCWDSSSTSTWHHRREGEPVFRLVRVRRRRRINVGFSLNLFVRLFERPSFLLMLWSYELFYICWKRLFICIYAVCSGAFFSNGHCRSDSDCETLCKWQVVISCKDNR